MAFRIYSTSGKIETLTFDYNETSPKQAQYYAGLKRETDNAINVLTPSLVPNTSIAYDNGSGWCSVTLGATESSTGKPINVSCSSNTGTASRACRIYLKYNNNTNIQQYIQVSQNGKDSWTITSPYSDTYKITDSSLTDIRWTVKRNGVVSNLNGSDHPDFSITKSDGSSIGTTTHRYNNSNPNPGIYLSEINNIEERQTYIVNASLGSQYGNASASFTLYREGRLYNTIRVRFLLQNNSNYYTTNNVGVTGSNNVQIGVEGFWTLNTSTDEYSNTVETFYYASTGKDIRNKYVSVGNFTPGYQSSKDVPKTYSWTSMTVCYSQSQKGIGPNLYAGGVDFTGGSLGTLPVINIPKQSFKVDRNNYYVTILIKPGGSGGNPLPKHEIISEKF